MEKNNKAQILQQDSGDYERWTKVYILEGASELMGGITLDVSSCEVANSRHNLIKYFYDIYTDGLTMRWFGKVWMNHPFSRVGNKLWIQKLLTEYNAGNIEQACCITYAAMNARWLSPLLSFPQYFFIGRVEYESPNGGSEGQVLKDSVVTFLPPKTMPMPEAKERLQVAFQSRHPGVAKW